MFRFAGLKCVEKTPKLLAWKKRNFNFSLLENGMAKDRLDNFNVNELPIPKIMLYFQFKR